MIKDRNGREKSAEVIGLEIVFAISRQSLCRLMYRLNFKKVKKSTKTGFNDVQKERRLKFCRKYRDWTLEDWKKVIFSDETSVVVGLRRGSYKVWRKPDEAQIEVVTRMRWKGFMEFMFWGCFSWYRKGPFHIWKSETEAEKKEVAEAIDTWNREAEPVLKVIWEEENFGEIWKWDALTGKRERRAKRRGIDWYRYGKLILEGKFLSFVFRYNLAYPGTIV